MAGLDGVKVETLGDVLASYNGKEKMIHEMLRQIVEDSFSKGVRFAQKRCAKIAYSLPHGSDSDDAGHAIIYNDIPLKEPNNDTE